MADDLIQFDGGVIVADMVQQATTTDSVELTRYAVEDGSLISDHVIRQPRTLALTLVQTETPITEVQGFARVLQALNYETRPVGKQTTTVPIRQSEFRPAPLLALGEGIRSLLFGGPPKELTITGLDTSGPLAGKDLKVHVLSAGAPVDRVNEFHDALVSLLETATPCILTFKGSSSVDMVLTRVARTDAAGAKGKATFEVEFQQIATVETQTVELPPVPKAKAPKQISARGGIQATPEQENRLQQSLLAFSSSADEPLESVDPTL